MGFYGSRKIKLDRPVFRFVMARNLTVRFLLESPCKFSAVNSEIIDMKRVWGILGSALFVLVIVAVAYRIAPIRNLVIGGSTAAAA